jgi:hypothetical protein
MVLPVATETHPILCAADVAGRHNTSGIAMAVSAQPRGEMICRRRETAFQRKDKDKGTQRKILRNPSYQNGATRFSDKDLILFAPFASLHLKCFF